MDVDAHRHFTQNSAKFENALVIFTSTSIVGQCQTHAIHRNFVVVDYPIRTKPPEDIVQKMVYYADIEWLGVKNVIWCQRIADMVKQSEAFRQRRAALQGGNVDLNVLVEKKNTNSLNTTFKEKMKVFPQVSDLPPEALSKICEMSGDFLAVERFANIFPEVYLAVKDWRFFNTGSRVFVKRDETIHLVEISSWMCGTCGGKCQDENGYVLRLDSATCKACGEIACASCKKKSSQDGVYCAEYYHYCRGCQAKRNTNTCDLCSLMYCDAKEEKCDKCGIRTCGEHNQFGASTCDYCGVSLCYQCAHHPPGRLTEGDIDMKDCSMWDCNFGCYKYSCNATGGGNSTCPEFMFDHPDEFGNRCPKCVEEDEAYERDHF